MRVSSVGGFFCAVFLLFSTAASADFNESQSERWSGSQAYHGQQTHERVAHAVGRAVSSVGSYISGRLVCAVNVNAELSRRGIQGTGSALAKSFLHWGRSSSPVPGAVAVYDRGGKSGHVAIVTRVEGGKVWVLNPGHRGWQEVVYHKHAIDYRVAS